MSDRVRVNDFIRMFQLDDSGFPEAALPLFDRYDLSSEPATARDLEEYVLHFLRLDDDPLLVRSREENLAAFERGWSENLEELRASGPEAFEEALKPKYFRGSRFFRCNDQLVTTRNSQLEYELFVVARLCLFHAYLKETETVCELGCGTCANLLLLSRFYPEKCLVGMDWTTASMKIADELGSRLGRSISGHVLDMIEPDSGLILPHGAAILSIHAFEQLGMDFEKILAFILSARPSIVLQYEPILDFYKNDSLLDYLALRYCKRRGYLQGYYGRLKELEKEGKIQIIKAYRPYLGGVLHESSVLVWKPL
jgi:hypothetical protein